MNLQQQDIELPEEISGLARISRNLWWTWHPETWELFRALDLQAWRESGENPIRMLHLLPPQLLREVTRDQAFMESYRTVLKCFEGDNASESGWFTEHHDGIDPKAIAYFSAEYALHVSLPLYAGGLGVLAGDYLKESSDLALPLVAVGLVYSRGYAWQRIREDGWPDDKEETIDRTFHPITRVLDTNGVPMEVEVDLFDPPIRLAVWQVEVGRVSLYLLDTDIDANQPWDRSITQHLYATNLEQRLRQEIVLGVGGMRTLHAMGIEPRVLHINEGHPAFAVLERIRRQREEGASFETALERVRESTVFTTHTPVAAGTDVFPFQLIEKYLGHYASLLQVDPKQLWSLGVNPEDPGSGFNMTVFALRVSAYCNAVSKRHGEVTRKMWSPVWPDRKQEEVPIDVVTNGVHLPSWVDPVQLQPLLSRHLGPQWASHPDDAGQWEAIDQIPDCELWNFHQGRKVALIAEINERARTRWQRDKIGAGQVLALGALLDPQILTVGFARRFTSYKRPDLILRDLARLERLLTDPWHPVQIIFAGKAHPADMEGKRLIQNIFRVAQKPELAGRVAFVEDYDQQLAAYMVQGVDLWLNNPQPPLEASGTSGMKASINGVPNISVLDGWWIEGFNGSNGWAFGQRKEGVSEDEQNRSDADDLYTILEQQVVPLYYERSDDEIPHGFVRIMKAAIQTVAPTFSCRRMAKEYVEKFYAKILAKVAETA